jgi:hypothetical protein
MQPLDNGPFSAVKAAYRKELKKYNSLSDARPIDKTNFIRAYNKAREDGLTEKDILSAFRITRNWPISRRKAFSHPEIQQDVENKTLKENWLRLLSIIWMLYQKPAVKSVITAKTKAQPHDFITALSPKVMQTLNSNWLQKMTRSMPSKMK